MENNKMMCEICGSEFTPEEIGKNHYIVRDNVKSGLAITFSTTEEYKLYDAFDCPVCKCQNIIGERKRGFVSAVSENFIQDEVVFIEKEENKNKPDCFGDYFDKLNCYGCKEETECIEQTKECSEED